MSKEKFKYTKEFLEKVKNGDNDATTLLYEDAKDIAYNKAYSILNNHHDAEDIAEDSVLRAIEKIDTIKKPSEFPAWIRRVAENKAKDYIKKDKPTYMGEDFEYTTNDLNSDQKVLPEKMADSQENIDLYKKLIAKLTDDQRNALVLNRIEGYKTREIAEMLGCSENTIKSRIHQGEKKLVKEAESLKKKGYTLNGMMPLDFFTVMSKSLGVTSTNVASVVGATVLKSLSMKIVASVVAVVVIVSGILGVNYIYNKHQPTKSKKVQMYGKVTKDEEKYINTLLEYTMSGLGVSYNFQEDNVENMILGALYACVNVTLNHSPKEDFCLYGFKGKNGKYMVPQKKVRKFLKNAFGRNISTSISAKKVKQENDNYYFDTWMPIVGVKYHNDIKSIKYNKNKSKITVKYLHYQGNNIDDCPEYTATFIRNSNNKEFPFRILSNIIEYNGKIVDFGDYTLKIPNSWAYDKIKDNIVFYEPKSKKAGEDSFLLAIESYNKIDKEHSHNEPLGYRKGKYFFDIYDIYGKKEYAEYQSEKQTDKYFDIQSAAKDLNESVLASFKLKNKG